jgi:hypothetical protein
MTPLGATAGQHFPSISCLHASAETMNGLAAAAMRLKCTFHLSVFFTFNSITRGEPGLFQFLPTGHHTRWFCERTAKVRADGQIFSFLGAVFPGGC